jgi:hypothetical protein
MHIIHQPESPTTSTFHSEHINISYQSKNKTLVLELKKGNDKFTNPLDNSRLHFFSSLEKALEKAVDPNGPHHQMTNPLN